MERPLNVGEWFIRFRIPSGLPYHSPGPGTRKQILIDRGVVKLLHNLRDELADRNSSAGSRILAGDVGPRM
jgi:hypothetical protein